MCEFLLRGGISCMLNKLWVLECNIFPLSQQTWWFRLVSNFLFNTNGRRRSEGQGGWGLPTSTKKFYVYALLLKMALVKLVRRGVFNLLEDQLVGEVDLACRHTFTILANHCKVWQTHLWQDLIVQILFSTYRSVPQ